jgi:putative phosphoesterase
MMIALISDVHANLIALAAVLEDMNGRGVERIISAGDVVGYYPYPNETVALFRERDVLSIQGNHDRAVITANVLSFNPAAGDAVTWTASQLRPASLAYLRGLPRHLALRIEEVRIAVFHGKPADDDHYLYEDECRENLLGQSRSDLLVLGHTHVPFIKRYPSGTVVNPGSVGQPRDGDPEASYALFDTTTRKTINRRVAYDIDEVAARTRTAGLPGMLADRLSLGI